MNDVRQIHDKTFTLLLSQEQIDAAVARESQRIALDYADLEPLFIVVLKGAFIFAADLIRSVNISSTVECISAASYGSHMQSSGTVRIQDALPSVRGRHVIVVEDIVDSGRTLATILRALEAQEPASISIAAFISKPKMHTVQIDVHYCCFEMESSFVIGYGLDYAEHGRELQGIYELVKE